MLRNLGFLEKRGRTYIHNQKRLIIFERKNKKYSYY